TGVGLLVGDATMESRAELDRPSGPHPGYPGDALHTGPLRADPPSLLIAPAPACQGQSPISETRDDLAPGGLRPKPKIPDLTLPPEPCQANSTSPGAAGAHGGPPHGDLGVLRTIGCPGTTLPLASCWATPSRSRRNPLGFGFRLGPGRAHLGVEQAPEV